MRVCPSCGSTNEAFAAQCVVCGGSLEGAPETRRPGQSDLAQTRLGVPSVSEQRGPIQEAAQSPDPGLGVRSGATAPDAPRVNLGGTQLLPPQEPTPQQPASQEPTPQQSTEPAAAEALVAPQVSANLMRTQVQYEAPGSQPRAAPPPAPAAPNPSLSKATMLGMPPASPDLGSGPPQGSVQLAKGTMLGMPPMPGGPVSPQGNTNLAKGTMLGIAPVDPAQVAAQAAAQREQRQEATESAGAPKGPAQVLSEKRTMLGVAMPGIAPTGSVTAPVTSEKRTMLGVAMPGIAPVRPGQAQPPAAAQYPDVPSPQPLAEDVLEVRQSRPIWPWFLVGLAVLILVGGVGVWLALRPSTPISARLESADDGKERLVLSCLACPDQSTVNLPGGGEPATFSAGQASLSLSQPLSVGDNELALDLTRPGSKTETVKLQIPVDYRVKVDIAALDEDPPKLALSVVARPGSEVEVEGKALQLDDDGKARWSEDVSQQLSGPASGVERLERELSYRVTPPGGSPESGKAKVRIGIAPLVVQAPLDSITIDKPRFLLAGSTLPGVEVTVAGRAIKRQPDGSFSQVMNVSTTGETTIRVKGALDEHAPRYIPVHVKRVESLDDAAKDFRKAKLATYSNVMGQLGKSAGSKVVWAGKVTDARSSEHRNILLLDVTGQCGAPPCLARVVYAGETPVKSGDRITAFGEVKRGVPGPRKGQSVPEVDAEFILKGGT